MVRFRTYRFGDVVDGHRWTMAGWEPVDPSPWVAAGTAVDDAPVVSYEVGDVVDGHRWTVVGWEQVDEEASLSDLLGMFHAAEPATATHPDRSP